MKNLLCLGLLLLAFQATLAQTATNPSATRPVANKTDDTILIELTDTPEAGWRRLAQVLVQRGYSIEHSDKDLLTVSTHALLQPATRNVRIAGTVVNSTLIIRMYWGGDTDTGGGHPWILSRRYNGSWQELETIAREIGGPVRYSTAAAGK